MITYTKADLGWSEHFARQITDDTQHLTPARITEVQRDRLRTLSEDGISELQSHVETGEYAVGDWVLSDGAWAVQRLDPITDFTRRAPGKNVKIQRIAANVDTLAIVTSCNADFNPARLERYLALASAAGCLPLIVLTKSDMADDPQSYLRAAERLSPLVTAIAVNATDPEDAQRLTPWCNNAQTLALVGSSGVGKTTLRNALTGESAETAGIREDDARGRHTTTFRSLVRTLSDGWLIDTPGMRELQLSDAADGIDAVFSDLTDLADTCKFRNCAHESEPGCAVQAAIAKGDIDQGQLDRWNKLKREDLYNSETIAQTRDRERGFSKMVREVTSKSKRKK